MRRKGNLLKKGISVLLSAAMVLSGVQFSGTGTAKVSAASDSVSIYGYATKDDLMDSGKYSLDTLKGGAMQKVYFGKQNGGSLEWYIVGKDDAQGNDNNIVLLSAKSLGDASFGGTCYADSTLASIIKGFEYGSNRDSLFTSAEDVHMLQTKLGNNASSDSVKLYALNINGNDITAGTGDKLSINNEGTGLRDFWLRESSTFSGKTIAYYANSTVCGSYSNTGASSQLGIVPAFDLDLSSVLFASTAVPSSEDGEFDSGSVMTLRFDAGSGDDAKIKSSAVYNSDKIIVTYASDDSDAGDLYLYVQGNDEDEYGYGNFVYAKKIEGSASGYTTQTINMSEIIYNIDVTKCKIWLETTDSDANLTYAREALQITDIASVSITDIAAPEADKALDTSGVCTTTGVTTGDEGAVTVTYTCGDDEVTDTKAGYAKEYTAKIVLEASDAYIFTADTSAKVNGNDATASYDSSTGKLTVTYTFDKTGRKTLSNTYYATVDDLINCFDLDGTDDTVGEIYFGTSDGTSEGTKLKWYIAGSDAAQNKDNVVLFSAQNFGTTAFQGMMGYSDSNLASLLASYEYKEDENGDKVNANAKFTSAEDLLMLETNLKKFPAKSAVKLYALDNSGEDGYIVAGVNDSVRVKNLYWGNVRFWLRSWSNEDLCDIPYLMDVAETSGSIGREFVGYTSCNIVPAFDLNLSSVLFASAAETAAAGAGLNTDTIELKNSTDLITIPVYTLRLKDDSSRITTTAAYTSDEVIVTKGADKGDVYLYVQDSQGVYSQLITEDSTISLSNMTRLRSTTALTCNSLTDSGVKIWLETTIDNVTYAAEASTLEKITAVTASVTEPVAGSALATTATVSEVTVSGTDNGAIGLASTQPTVSYKVGEDTVSGNAKYNKTYTATFTLTAADGYVFSSSITKDDITINAATAKSIELTDSKTLLVTAEFTTPKAELISVTNPADIKGVANGTEYSAEALGLVKSTAIETQDEAVTSADITWNLENLAEGSYYPSVLTEQTFKVNGTVSLPEDIANSNNVSLNVQVAITVSAAGVTGIPTADVASGSYSQEKEITLTSSTQDANIYYTITNDTSEPYVPTASDTKYEGSVKLSGAAGKTVTYRIKAFAQKEGMQDSEAVEFTYTIQIPAVKYAVTVTGGLGSGEYEEGETVTITASEAPSGYKFKEWSPESANVTLESAESTSISFVMPAQEVIIKAVYEEESSPADTTDESTEPEVADNKTETIPDTKDEAPSITEQPQDAAVESAGAVTFSVTVSGANLSYQWMVNKNDENGWVNVGGANEASYTVSTADSTYNGYQYKCVITGGGVTIESNPVTLTISDTKENDTTDNSKSDEENNKENDNEVSDESEDNEESETSSEANSGNAVPDTGDKAPVGLLILLMSLSAAVMAATTVSGGRRRKVLR